MFTTNQIFCHGKIRLFENITKPQWAIKTAVLMQSDLVIFSGSFTDDKEDGKISMLNMKTALTRTEGEWQIDLIRNNKRNCFRLETIEEAEKWHKMLLYAISWSNYEHFCEFQKLKPWIFLLRWAARGSTSLKVSLKKCNSLALAEFLRGNTYIEELKIEDMDNEVGVTSKILMCFNASQLRILVLANSSLDDNSLLSLKKVIRTNNFLQVLDMKNNYLSPLSVGVFYSIFVYMPYLEDLKLSGNKVSDDGFQELVPGILGQIPVKILELSNCGITDMSVSTVCRVFRIRNILLEVFDISDNLFTFEGVRVLMKSWDKNNKKNNIEIKVYPVVVKDETVKYLPYGEYILKKSAKGKTMPKVLRHRETIDKISKKIDSVTENPYIEDLCDLINELAYLDFQFPKVRLEKLEKIVNNYLSIAISQPNYYCLELLIPAIRKIGIFHTQAEELLNYLQPEADHIINTLENVLTQSLYTEENIPEINDLLDNAVKRCDELCIRGEIVEVAKMLKNKRDIYAKKI